MRVEEDLSDLLTLYQHV